jgi:hypothetical protein
VIFKMSLEGQETFPDAQVKRTGRAYLTEQKLKVAKTPDG